MSRKNKKWMAYILSIVLIVGCFPTSIIARDLVIEAEQDKIDVSSNNDSDETIVSNDSKHTEPSINEVVELRSENTKHFDMGDGTYQAVTYGYPVHRKDATGEWKDIDNTLTIERGSSTQYKTKDSRVNFASEYSSSTSLLTLRENGYTIEMSFVSPIRGAVSAAKVSNPVLEETSLSSDRASDNIDELIRVNNSSSIKYENVLDNVDLEYILHSNDVKENIIVNEPCVSYSYTFELKVDNMIAELDETGVIYFCDAMTGEAVYVIPVQYMYDDNGAVSYEVDYQLKQIKNGIYKLTIIADEEWINAEEREFPVVIDPTLSSAEHYTYDTYFNATDATTKDTCYGYQVDMWISNLYRTPFIKSIQMPTLPAGATITYAALYVAFYYNAGVTGGMYVTAHQVNKYWNETYSWNTMSEYGQDTSLGISSTPISTAYLKAATSYPRWAPINVTTAAKSWYSGNNTGSNNNYGVALKYQSGNGSVILHSFNAKNGCTPYFTVTYEVPTGVYAIGKANTDVYVKNNTVDKLSQVFQETFASPPTDQSDRDYLFKIAYRAATDDYVIRSMSNNEIIIYASLTNGRPLAGRVTVSGAPATDSNISAGYTWKITKTSDAYYYIWYQGANATYYMRSTSNEGEPALTLTTNPNDTGTKWNFHQYTGDPIDGIGRINFLYELVPNEMYTHQAYMYSSTVGRNGPVSYSSGDTSVLTVGSSSGVVTAVAPGRANIWVTYYGAPLKWGRIATVEESMEGTYYIGNYATGKLLTPNADLEQWEYARNKDQIWELIYDSGGYYRIKNTELNKYLTSPVSNVSGRNITQEDLLTGDNVVRQRWNLIKQANGSYQINAENRETYVVSITSSSLSNGIKIVQKSPNDGDGTKWNFAYSSSFLSYGSTTLILTLQMTGTGTGSANDGGMWQSAISNAVSAWNNAGVGANLTASSTVSSNYTIKVEENDAGWYGLCSQAYSASSGSTSKGVITLNSRTLPSGTTTNDANFRQSVAVHEMGHLLSLADNPPVATGNESIMSYARNKTVVITPQAFDVGNVRFRHNTFNSP